jgi:poly(3-hydroxybutyrate) depolymerase
MIGRAPAFAIATVCIIAATTAVSAQRQGAGPYSKQRVSFTTDGLTLVGFLFKPAGAGPFPALIWNHGSEQSPGVGPQFDTVAGIFVPAGYVVFAPVRRGHGLSEGMYIGDQVQRAVSSRARSRHSSCSCIFTRPSSSTTSSQGSTM